MMATEQYNYIEFPDKKRYILHQSMTPKDILDAAHGEMMEYHKEQKAGRQGLLFFYMAKYHTLRAWWMLNLGIQEELVMAMPDTPTKTFIAFRTEDNAYRRFRERKIPDEQQYYLSIIRSLNGFK